MQTLRLFVDKIFRQTWVSDSFTAYQLKISTRSESECGVDRTGRKSGRRFFDIGFLPQKNFISRQNVCQNRTRYLKRAIHILILETYTLKLVFFRSTHPVNCASCYCFGFLLTQKLKHNPAPAPLLSRRKIYTYKYTAMFSRMSTIEAYFLL